MPNIYLDDDRLLEAFDDLEKCSRFQPGRFDRKALDAALRRLTKGSGGAA